MKSLWLFDRYIVLLQMPRTAAATALLTAAFLYIIPVPLQAEIIAYHKEPYLLSSGSQSAIEVETIQIRFSEIVQVTGVPWLKLHFSDYNLGTKSYIEIISIEDGSRQRLDSNDLKLWRDSSAYFNGDGVEINLYVAPGETDIFINIEEITVGERIFQIESLCGSDDRITTRDNRVGRIEPAGCTGWLVSNGAYLTAGHCTVGDGTLMDTIEFNVPPSDPYGTKHHPPVADQYPINASSIKYFDDGPGEMGNDWAVFTVLPNPNTNLLPIHAYEHDNGGFYRMIIDNTPTTARVTGYGADDGVDNYTQQTDTGAFLNRTIEGASDVILEYSVDTRDGNSGSPIMNNVLGQAIGIHTNAGCNPPDGGNHGTGFENDDLENAIQTAPGENVQYVDWITSYLQNGTVFWPYGTVLEAVNATSGSGAIVSIVAGTYNETMTISKAVVLKAPVGTVTIGQ